MSVATTTASAATAATAAATSAAFAGREFINGHAGNFTQNPHNKPSERDGDANENNKSEGAKDKKPKWESSQKFKKGIHNNPMRRQCQFTVKRSERRGV